MTTEPIVPPPAPPDPPSPADPKPSAFQRIGGVLFSPGETFESIARRPDWVVPFLIIIGLALIGGIALGTRLDFHALARDAMDANPKTAEMPADAAETATKFMAASMKIGSFLAPVLTAIGIFLTAGVLQLAFRLFGGEGTFKQALAVTNYAWMPRAIKGILGLIVILSRESVDIFTLQNPVMSNLGFLFAPKDHPLGFALASSLDVFSIWCLILLIIGFSKVSRQSTSKSASIVIGLWVVVTLLMLIGPAIQALKS